MNEPETYEPDTLYSVRLKRKVTVGAFDYLPRALLQMRGALLNRIVEEGGRDAIRCTSRA